MKENGCSLFLNGECAQKRVDLAASESRAGLLRHHSGRLRLLELWLLELRPGLLELARELLVGGESWHLRRNTLR